MLDNFFHCSVHSEVSDGAEITTTKENHGGELVRSCRNGGQENCRGFVISTHVEFVEQPTYWIGFNVLGFGHVETDISKLILLWRLHLAIPGNLIEFALCELLWITEKARRHSIVESLTNWSQGGNVLTHKIMSSIKYIYIFLLSVNSH